MDNWYYLPSNIVTVVYFYSTVPFGIFIDVVSVRQNSPVLYINGKSNK